MAAWAGNAMVSDDSSHGGPLPMKGKPPEWSASATWRVVYGFGDGSTANTTGSDKGSSLKVDSGFGDGSGTKPTGSDEGDLVHCGKQNLNSEMDPNTKLVVEGSVPHVEHGSGYRVIMDLAMVFREVIPQSLLVFMIRSRLLFLIFTVVIEGFVGLQTTLVTDLGFASRNGLDIAYDSRSLGSGQGVHVKGTPDGSYMVPYENANGVSVAADNDARHRSADIQGTGPCTKEHQGVATDLMILGCWVSLESGPSVCTMQSEHVISAGHLGAVDYTHKSVIAGEHVDLGLDHHVVDGSHKSTSNCADKVIMDREGAGFHGFDIENTRGEEMEGEISRNFPPCYLVRNQKR
ncbi:hypothetical protein AMTR_s00053p00215970 [Amborella trichopoda]|uniref:Uncharacterized protein n=1 Tax=Amborella trichopoda TaxID=13333 RepID=W1PDQ8_AMBTC|nr:hypothetical protein AMTR_s00053p00215970 [Amborella trichopoda]